ncbi:hypothetical protein QL285_052746 [Trifolium repens]|nr:hypothetical protein QL285_052746 [Trifolium repens]
MTTKENLSCKTENLGKAKLNNPNDTKLLLDICTDEIRNSGKPGAAFRNKKWEEIRTIVADPSWWEAKIRENAKYAKFRYQGLEFREELEFIFGETVATSQDQWTPALGIPSESNGKNTIDDVLLENIESDDDDIILVENTQSKKKRKVSPDMGEKGTKVKTKVGTATTMRNTFERLVQAAESHNEVEKAEIAATYHVHGQYSIPDCVKILKSLMEEGLLDAQQFSYGLEMLKDESNRILLMSLKYSMNALVDWLLYKYK